MFSYLPELLSRHLSPADPITLEYTVRVDQEYNMGPTAFDIDVELENPLRDRIKLTTQKHNHLQKDINSLDEQVRLIFKTVDFWLVVWQKKC